MALVDTDHSTLDRRNAMADQITQAEKVHLQTIAGSTNLQKEIGTNISCPNSLDQKIFVEGYTSVVEWIGANFESFEQHIQTTTLCISLAYDLLRVEGYYNACISVSTLNLLGDPGTRTPVSFQMLLDDLTWGHYMGQPLPATLQLLFLPANG